VKASVFFVSDVMAGTCVGEEEERGMGEASFLRCKSPGTSQTEEEAQKRERDRQSDGHRDREEEREREREGSKENVGRPSRRRADTSRERRGK